MPAVAGLVLRSRLRRILVTPGACRQRRGQPSDRPGELAGQPPGVPLQVSGAETILAYLKSD